LQPTRRIAMRTYWLQFFIDLRNFKPNKNKRQAIPASLCVMLGCLLTSHLQQEMSYKTFVSGNDKHQFFGTLCRVLVYAVIICLEINCSNNKKDISSQETYCDYLQYISKDYSNGSNHNLNKYIPILEKQSGISSHATKGTIGYWYNSDSIFIKDYSLWKSYFKCE
jgi:hypothetical protein